MEKDITPIEPSSKKPRSKFKVILALVFMAIAIIYDISPVDIIPDVIPVVGWGDDLLITGAAIWNLIKQIKSNKES